MKSDLQPYNWRNETSRVVWELDRAHSTLQDLSCALDEGDERSAQHTLQLAHDAVTSVAHSVKAMRAELPPDADSNEPEVVGSTLAVGGSGVATIALDVLVNAMVALSLTDDTNETDFLIGACVDAESAYEVSAAVLHAAPERQGAAMLELRRAFETDGGIALRKKLTRARPRVREIYERARRAA
jgi:hypothetical protein